MSKTTLLRSAAVGAVLTFGMGAAAHAAPADCVQKCVKPVHRRHHHMAPKPVENPLAEQVEALKAEVASLEQRLDASTAAAQQAQTAAQQAQASAQAAQSAAQTQEAAISQIPADVDTAVARLPKPKDDAWYFKGVKFTPGGFIAAESVYRSRGLGSDFSVPFGSIPYNGSSVKSSHTSEWRQTARQSRISGLAEGNVTPDLKLSAYGEFDFLGAAQTANSNESNSYNLRIRHIYLTMDSKSTGLSLLAGQTWSLVTLNDKGITPRNELIPLTIDAQYAVGFTWARQPQLRLTEDFGNGLWAAVSVETPQTAGVVSSALMPGYGNLTWNQGALGGSLFNSANSYSLNQVPDIVAKVAYDNTVGGHHVHLEGFGLFRDFYDRVGTGCAGSTCTGYHNTNTQGGGGGFGVIAAVLPKVLDVNVSGLFGKGIGRYGTSGLPDVYYGSNGSLQGIGEYMLLLGATLHATPKLDIYANLGTEQDWRDVSTVNGAPAGYGNPNFSNEGGCELAGGACNGNTKGVEQAVLGFWDKTYSGDFGSFKFGMQYSYTRRESFNGVTSGVWNGTGANAPMFGSVKGDDNMIYTSIRYFPFSK